LERVDNVVVAGIVAGHGKPGAFGGLRRYG